jgi:hypothetical protein
MPNSMFQWTGKNKHCMACFGIEGLVMRHAALSALEISNAMSAIGP